MEVYKLYRRLLWVQAEVICISSYQSIICNSTLAIANVSFCAIVTRLSRNYDLSVPILVTVMTVIVLAVFCIALELLVFIIALNHIFTSSRPDGTIMKVIPDIRRHFNFDGRSGEDRVGCGRRSIAGILDGDMTIGGRRGVVGSLDGHTIVGDRSGVVGT